MEEKTVWVVFERTLSSWFDRRSWASKLSEFGTTQ